MRIELRIDKGKGKDTDNIKIFDQLFKHKADIEEKFGDSLDWENADEFRMCAIRKDYEIGGYRNEDSYETIADQAIDAMMRLEKATKEYVKNIEI